MILKKRMRLAILGIIIFLLSTMSFTLETTMGEELFYENEISWTSVSTTGTPTARGLHRMTYDIEAEKIILFGGQVPGPTSTGQTFEYDASTNSWNIISPTLSPTPRNGHNMVYDSKNNVSILFGGYDGTSKQDTQFYNYSEVTWVARSPVDKPDPRQHHMMAYDPINEKTILFGGWDGTSYFYQDTWAYDFTLNTWTNMTSGIAPISRTSASMAYHPIMQKVLFFGGFDDGIGMGDTWIYDYQSNTWEQLFPSNSPSPRYDHTLVYDEVNQRMVLFGGDNELLGRLDDTWYFDHEVNTWKQLYNTPPPDKRSDFDIVFDKTIGKLVMFGGTNGASYFGDTYEFDWTRTSYNPSPGEIYPQEVKVFFGDQYDNMADMTSRPDGGFCLTGTTASSNFLGQAPLGNPFAGGTYDAYYMCYDKNGFMTQESFFGGTGDDYTYAIDVNSQNQIIIGGYTSSVTFPVTSGTYQGGYDAYIAMLNPLSSSVSNAYYIGGSNFDILTDIALDSTDNVIISGYTSSTTFTTGPPVSGGNQVSHTGVSDDGYLAKLNPQGNHVWSTYINGNSAVRVQGIAVDSEDNIWVFGWTVASTLQTTLDATQSSLSGNSDYFIQKYHSNGTLLYSSYLGGSGEESEILEYSPSIDSQNNFIISGSSNLFDFPTQGTGFNLTDNGGPTDAVIVKIAPDGSIIWSSYFGGDADDNLYDVSIDANDDIYLTGLTTSTNIPTTPDAFQPSHLASSEGVIVKISSDGSKLLYSSYYGSYGADIILGHVYNEEGKLIIGGRSSNGFHLPGYQEDGARLIPAGSMDVFIAKIYADSPAATEFVTESETVTTTENQISTTTEVQPGVNTTTTTTLVVESTITTTQARVTFTTTEVSTAESPLMLVPILVGLLIVKIVYTKKVRL